MCLLTQSFTLGCREDIGGIKKKVMTMGLEPGEQNGEGVWEVCGC